LKKKLTIGFSPCPNDTFIFDALVNGLIDTGGITFKPVLEDVQTLNKWALKGKLDITKLSYGVLPLILDKYIVLPSGGALGKGVGPLLIAKESFPITDVDQYNIAIPGENTTAHFLFSLAFPTATKKEFMVFSEIENAVITEQTRTGVIIHENRFTYQDKNLVKLMDLGEYWETRTGNPIPLGAIVMKRTLPEMMFKKVNELIQQSLAHSWKQYPVMSEYVRIHSQEMDERVMKQHIDLYVNDYTNDLGDNGKKAVLELLEIFKKVNPAASVVTEKIFSTD
jgi:1,4-dihydroxy-6-naphthoate synthase